MNDADSAAEAKSYGDEQKIGRAVSIGLPLLTIAAAGIVGLLMGPATSILVVAAGILLGVIALLWGSLRILSGDASLSPELEALDMATQGVDLLSSRRTMLLRSLKDLENERRIGKLDDDDYDQISAIARTELKDVLRRIDESLAPHRSRAEDVARAHLVRAGISVEGPRGPKLEDDADAAYAGEHDGEADATPEKPVRSDSQLRVKCRKCKASNEPDAKFCKGCAGPLDAADASTASSAEKNREVVDED